MVMFRILCLLVLAQSLVAQYVDRNLTQLLGSGALPASCTTGDVAFRTDAVAGINLYFCTAANTWTLMSGGGGGSTELRLDIQDALFPTTNPGVLQCRESSSGAPRPKWCEILYSTGDLANWGFIVPESYTGTVTIEVQYKMVSATINNTAWSSRFGCVTPGDAIDFDANAFAAADTSADDTVPGTAGYLASHTWTASNLDNMTAGDYCAFQLVRATPSGADATGDAEVVGVAIEW